MDIRQKGNLLALIFASYTLGLMLFTFWLSNSPLGEPRIFLREPGLETYGESEEERLAAIDAAGHLPSNISLSDYDDQYLSRLKLVALDGTIKSELDNGVDYRNLPDFAAITVIAERKKAFFDYLRPAVQFQNQLVRERRVILKGIEITLKSSQSLNKSQQRYMDLVRARYKVPEDLSELAAVEILMRRMDTIPVSMVLAQAALESAWGQSRFAREANNLFGQWCFSKGCGMVPNSRPEGETYEVATFDSVDQEIAAYFQNIIAFHRYSAIRDIREAARRIRKPLLGHDMVAGIEAYSTRGEDYIKELRHIISYNQLE